MTRPKLNRTWGRQGEREAAPTGVFGEKQHADPVGFTKVRPGLRVSEVWGAGDFRADKRMAFLGDSHAWAGSDPKGCWARRRPSCTPSPLRAGLGGSGGGGGASSGSCYPGQAPPAICPCRGTRLPAASSLTAGEQSTTPRALSESLLTPAGCRAARAPRAQAQRGGCGCCRGAQRLVREGWRGGARGELSEEEYPAGGGRGGRGGREGRDVSARST